jgi:competence protein ComGC
MMKGMNRKLGFTVKEILILVTIVAMIAVVAIPSYVKARNKSQQRACINNLRYIDSSKFNCSMCYRLTVGDKIATASVNEYLIGATTPICPSGGTYTYGNIGSDPECTITTHAYHWRREVLSRYE